MINYEEIKAMMGQYNPPIVTETIETPAPKIAKYSKLYVSKTNKQSLKKLATRINDMKCYSTISLNRKVVSTGEILSRSKAIGHFDYGKIFCGDCSTTINHGTYEEHMDYGMIMLTPNGAVVPSALLCPKCETNYMQEIKKI